MIPKSPRQLFFFLLSGGVGFTIYYVLSNALYYCFEVPTVASALLAMLVSVFPTYYMQRSLTFKSQVTVRHGLPRYLLLQVANAAVIGSVTYLCDRLHAPQAFSFAIAGFTGVAVSFAVQDKIVFREQL